MLNISISRESRSIVADAVVPNGNINNDVGSILGQLILRRVYRFQAERMTLGISGYGTNPELQPNAQNLPEVLNILQGNPQSFKEYCGLIAEVFPSIKWISVRPHPGGGSQIEILVWQTDPSSQRDDLAIPLNQCGTGVGQVLSMIYVVKTSEQPKSIIIDEPGSFLHPSASRTLIEILRRFNQHQYIIATHSPELISELSDAAVTIIRWTDSVTSFVTAPRATSSIAATALSEVGAKLSDVFGFDKILWVEGQSDAEALKLILAKTGRPQRKVGILPVRDTGSFKGRRPIAEIHLRASASL
jgi:hypothetical protein